MEKILAVAVVVFISIAAVFAYFAIRAMHRELQEDKWNEETDGEESAENVVPSRRAREGAPAHGRSRVVRVTRSRAGAQAIVRARILAGRFALAIFHAPRNAAWLVAYGCLPDRSTHAALHSPRALRRAERVELPAHEATVPVAHTAEQPPWGHAERASLTYDRLSSETGARPDDEPEDTGRTITFRKTGKPVFDADAAADKTEAFFINGEFAGEEEEEEILVTLPLPPVIPVITEGVVVDPTITDIPPITEDMTEADLADMTVVLDGHTIIHDGKPVREGDGDADHDYLTATDLDELQRLLQDSLAPAGGIADTSVMNGPVVTEHTPSIAMFRAVPALPARSPHEQWPDGKLISPRDDFEALACEIHDSSVGNAMLAIESLSELTGAGSIPAIPAISDRAAIPV